MSPQPPAHAPPFSTAGWRRRLRPVEIERAGVCRCPHVVAHSGLGPARWRQAHMVSADMFRRLVDVGLDAVDDLVRDVAGPEDNADGGATAMKAKNQPRFDVDTVRELA